MAKIKLTKGELKRQRDALKQFSRYLPTLQLKKQQLQLEILQQNIILEEKKLALNKKRQALMLWAGVLNDPQVDLKPFLQKGLLSTRVKNIAGLDIVLFVAQEFVTVELDLFSTPLWTDAAIIALQEIIVLQEELALLNQGIILLRQELRITAQRVNLFEKVKIPEAQDNIRQIKIYIGDQLANAVGRSKIAKRKIEEQAQVEVLV